MGLLSRKTKTDAVQFARRFYDESVFAEGPGGLDMMATFTQTNHRLISEADPSFADVDIDAFNNELLAMRMEMIQTAWTHKSKDEPAITISQFTKEYLGDKQPSNLWEVMADYNHAVAEAASVGIDGKSRLGRATLVGINKMRADLFDKWYAATGDEEAVARVIKRLGSQANWKDPRTQALIAFQVTRHLDLEGSEDIWHPLSAVAYGFYQGAKEALDGVKLI